MATPPKKPTKAPAKPSAEKAPSRLPPEDGKRYVSLHQLGQTLDRNPSTLRQWLAAGMPYLKRGDIGKGQKWLFDVADVVQWREDQVAERTRGVPDSRDGGEPIPVNDMDVERIRAQREMLKLAKEARYAVNPDAVVAITTRHHRDVSNSVMSIPDLLARDLTGIPDAMKRKLVRDMKERIAEILKAAAEERTEAIEGLFSDEDEVEFDE